MLKAGGFPYKVYSKLYSTCVTTVSDYGAALTGFPSYDCLDKLQLRAIRAFLGVPKNACSPGVFSEVDFLLPNLRTQLEMLRYYHRLVCMDSSMLPKLILTGKLKIN